mgnify:CR=1 FL=1
MATMRNRPTPPPGEPRVICPPGRAYVPRGTMSTEQLRRALEALRYVPRDRLRQAVNYLCVREWLRSDACPAEHRQMVEEWQRERRAWREERRPASAQRFSASA